MSYERWKAVDDFVGELLVGADVPLDEAVARSTREGLPAIAVSPPQGKFLYLLARIHGARRVLELGTLGGYSTIWLARALPRDGVVVTLELDPRYAQVAGENFARAGVADMVEQHVGPALDTLRELRTQDTEPFDMVFIDADKQTTPEYFTECVELTRRAGVIVVDNVVRDGEVAVADSDDAGARGMRRFHEQLTESPRWSATTIQTVGVKGYDGFTLVLLDE